MIVIGCDPGSDGALYELRREQAAWVPGEYLLMPMRDTGKRIRAIDVKTVRDWIRARATPPALVVLEAVGYMPVRENAGSGGGFGDAILAASAGKLEGMLEALDYPYERPVPQAWQKVCGVKVARTPGETRPERKKKVKAATAAFVTRRFPKAVLIPPGCRVPNGGLIDALALAHWGTFQLPPLLDGIIRLWKDGTGAVTGMAGT